MSTKDEKPDFKKKKFCVLTTIRGWRRHYYMAVNEDDAKRMYEEGEDEFDIEAVAPTTTSSTSSTTISFTTTTAGPSTTTTSVPSLDSHVSFLT